MVYAGAVAVTVLFAVMLTRRTATGKEIISFASIRNKIARGFGYSNYYEMMFELQELDVDRIHGIFKEFKNKTDETFRIMKEEVDTRLSEQFGVSLENVCTDRAAEGLPRLASLGDIWFRNH